MNWDIYREIRLLDDGGESEKALAAIDAARGAMVGDVGSHIACLEATCHARAGRPEIACQLLERFVAEGSSNFWVYWNLAILYRNMGAQEKASRTYQKAHGILGWPESERNGYFFTHDYFAPNIPRWKSWFAENIRSAPIRLLEIGSWQGGSATWLLDNVVSRRGGLLTCVDTFAGSSEHALWIHDIGDKLENLFDHNIQATGHAAQCRKMVGDSKKVLRSLGDERFDFIYIDGAHEAKFVIQDAVLAWPLVEPNGFLLFDDVKFHFPQSPEQDTATALDAFLSWFARDLEVIHRDSQLLVRKLKD